MSAVLPVFVICAVACLVAHIAIIRSVMRSRATREGDAADVPQPRLVTEVVWALIPALALAFLLGVTWTRVRHHADAPSSAPVETRA